MILEVLAIQRPPHKPHPEDPDYQLALARTENSLGNLYSNTSQPRTAIEVLERAKALQLLLTEKHPLVLA
jgi:hypothetical protein